MAEKKVDLFELLNKIISTLKFFFTSILVTLLIKVTVLLDMKRSWNGVALHSGFWFILFGLGFREQPLYINFQKKKKLGTSRSWLLFDVE